jgi:hypothetical protein
MEWSGRAPAPSAIEAGKGRQRRGARYVPQSQQRSSISPLSIVRVATVKVAVTTWLLSCRNAGKVANLYIRWRATWGIPD